MDNSTIIKIIKITFNKIKKKDWKIFFVFFVDKLKLIENNSEYPKDLNNYVPKLLIFIKW